MALSGGSRSALHALRLRVLAMRVVPVRSMCCVRLSVVALHSVMLELSSGDVCTYLECLHSQLPVGAVTAGVSALPTARKGNDCWGVCCITALLGPDAAARAMAEGPRACAGGAVGVLNCACHVCEDGRALVPVLTD